MSTRHSDIMTRLRDSTRELHGAAEHHAFQQALLGGRLPRNSYAQWLAQMLLVHRALEAHLRQQHDSHSAFREVVRDYQYKEPHLVTDLAALGLEANAGRPMPACRELTARIHQAAAENPVALLGYHYVLEGSTNGGQFIAKAVRRAYDLPPGQGASYLDPYGTRQPEHWQAFIQNMNRVPFSEDERECIVAAAREMFVYIARIGTDLCLNRE